VAAAIIFTTLCKYLRDSRLVTSENYYISIHIILYIYNYINHYKSINVRSYPKPQHSLVRSRKVQVVVWVGLSVHSVASVKLFCRVLHIAAVLCQFYALQWCCTRSARGRLQKDREGGQVPVICDNVGPWESRLEKPQLFVSANIQCPLNVLFGPMPTVFNTFQQCHSSCSSCSSGSQQVPEALVTSRAIHRIPALDISSGHIWMDRSNFRSSQERLV